MLIQWVLHFSTIKDGNYKKQIIEHWYTLQTFLFFQLLQKIGMEMIKDASNSVSVTRSLKTRVAKFKLF